MGLVEFNVGFDLFFGGVGGRVGEGEEEVGLVVLGCVGGGEGYCGWFEGFEGVFVVWVEGGWGC